MRRLVRSILDSRLLRGERGGAAIMMLMAFMVLAVPLSIAAVQTAGQLTRSSQVYDKRLTAQYNAGAGVEVAVYKVLSDPLFDDGLTPSSPSKVITADLPSDIVTITVTKIFSSASVAGQGLVVTKTVTPTTATAATLTTYTYTGKIKNEGSSAQQIMEITDFAPPGFTYVLGSTSGDITSNDPSISVGSAKVADYYLNHTGSGTSYPMAPDPGRGYPDGRPHSGPERLERDSGILGDGALCHRGVAPRYQMETETMDKGGLTFQQVGVEGGACPRRRP